MDVRPIRSDADHAEALAEVERLWGAPIGSPEGDKLDVLATLVEAYEETRWPIEAQDPVDIIRYAISDQGRSQAELADLLGSRSRASEVLNRRRALTVDMVHRISTSWHIPADLLVRPYHLANDRFDRVG